MIPERTIHSLKLYSEHKCQPGGFLTAVLQNDLFAAMGRADTENKQALPDIVTYIYNEMPGDCWGSEKIVQDFLNKS